MNHVVFRDFAMLMVLAFVAMVVMMLPHLNPPGELAEDAMPPGNVIAHITWPPGDVDVDLWVSGPDELRAVGYSNHNGLLWNLLRDDLGAHPDATPLNYENAYTRGVLPGEYIVNVHCYRCSRFPVAVIVTVSTRIERSGKSTLRTLATTEVPLRRNGQEVTAMRFRLDAQGDMVAGSLNHVFLPLRDGRKSQ